MVPSAKEVDLAWDPERPSFSQRILLAIAPFPAAWILRALAATWRVRFIRVEGQTPRRRSGAAAYAIWHEHVLALGGIFKGEPVRSLISRSFDGELITRTARHLGQAPTLRGSSSRGGTAALKQMGDALLQGDSLLVTVDGPRGPRRQAKAGVAKAAQLSGAELLTVSMAASHGLRFRSWDRQLLPLPFSAVTVAFGRPWRIPRGEAELAKAMARMQAEMEALGNEAEADLKGASRRTA